MKTFKDLVFTVHPNPIHTDGVQSRIIFDNGFGASVVRTHYSYGGNEGLYELAVLDKNGHITYDTPITNDVIGYLTEEGVTEALTQIQQL